MENHSKRILFSPIRSFSQTASSDEDSEEWRPSEPKTKTRKATRDPASKKPKPFKRTAKRSEPKESIEPEGPKNPKPAPEKKTNTAKDVKNTGESALPVSKMKQNNEGRKKREAGGNTKKQQMKCPEEQPTSTSGPSIRIKEEVGQTAVKNFTTRIFLLFKIIFSNEFCFLIPFFSV